jgi:hypothetical protein
MAIFSEKRGFIMLLGGEITRLKCRRGLVAGMMTTLYIGFGITILLLLLQIGLLLVIGQRIEAVFRASIFELDHKIAEAIASVMEKVPGFSEEAQEFNPIQAAIGQLIANMADKNQTMIPPKVVERDSKGLFIETSD